MISGRSKRKEKFPSPKHVKGRKKPKRKSRSKKRSRKRMNDGYIINVNQNYVPFGCKVPKAFI